MKHLHYHVGQMEGWPEPLQPQTRHPNLSVPRGNPLSMLTKKKRNFGRLHLCFLRNNTINTAC